MELIIANESQLKINPEIFTKVLGKVAESREEKKGEKVELLLTNNTALQKLNKQFRDKDEPTDVLSFPMLEGKELWGQIVISVERAQEQSDEIGQSLEDELQFLFTHGLLHLFGYDHQTPEDEKLMLEEAYRILGPNPGKK